MPVMATTSASNRFDYSSESSISYSRTERSSSSSTKQQSSDRNGYSKLHDDSSDEQRGRSETKPSARKDFFSREYSDDNNNFLTDVSLDDSVFSDTQVYKDEVKEYASTIKFEKISNSEIISSSSKESAHSKVQAKSLRSPHMTRKVVEPMASGYQKVSVKSGQNEVSHFSKVESDDEDWISPEKLKEIEAVKAEGSQAQSYSQETSRLLVYEDVIADKDERRFASSGERNLEEVMQSYDKRNNISSSFASGKSRVTGGGPVSITFSYHDSEQNEDVQQRTHEKNGTHAFGNQTVVEEEYRRQSQKSRLNKAKSSDDNYKLGENITYEIKLSDAASQLTKKLGSGRSVSFNPERSLDADQVHNLHDKEDTQLDPVSIRIRIDQHHEKQQQGTEPRHQQGTSTRQKASHVHIKANDRNAKAHSINEHEPSDTEPSDGYYHQTFNNGKSKTKIFTEDTLRRRQLLKEEETQRREHEFRVAEEQRRLFEQRQLEEQSKREKLKIAEEERHREAMERREEQQQLQREKEYRIKEEQERTRRAEKEREIRDRLAYEEQLRCQQNRRLQDEQRRREEAKKMKTQDELWTKDYQAEERSQGEYLKGAGPQDVEQRNWYNPKNQKQRPKSADPIKLKQSHIDVYLQKKNSRSTHAKSESDSHNSEYLYDAHTHRAHNGNPVHVVVSPVQRRKQFQTIDLPVDISVARDGSRINKQGYEQDRFKVVVSPMPHLQGFVPVHIEDHHRNRLQQDDEARCRSSVRINDAVAGNQRIYDQNVMALQQQQKQVQIAHAQQAASKYQPNDMVNVQERRRQQELQRMENARLERMRIEQNSFLHQQEIGQHDIHRRHSLHSQEEMNRAKLNASITHTGGSRTLPRKTNRTTQVIDGRLSQTNVHTSPASEHQQPYDNAESRSAKGNQSKSTNFKNRSRIPRSHSVHLHNERDSVSEKAQIKASNPNLILGRTETKDYEQRYRPKSVDISRHAYARHTLPRNFGRTKSEELVDREVMKATKEWQKTPQPNFRADQPRHLVRPAPVRQRAISTTELDDYRLAEAQQKYLQKKESISFEPAFRYHDYTEKNFANEEKTDLGQHTSHRDALNIIAGSHVEANKNFKHSKDTRDESNVEQTVRAVQTVTTTHTAYRTKLLKEKGESTTGYTPPRRGVEIDVDGQQKKAITEDRSSEGKYERVKVYARGGVIQLSLEEAEEALPYSPPTEYPNPITKSEPKANFHEYDKSSNLPTHRTHISNRTQGRSDSLAHSTDYAGDDNMPATGTADFQRRGTSHFASKHNYQDFHQSKPQAEYYCDNDEEHLNGCGSERCVDEAERSSSHRTHSRQDHMRYQPEKVNYTVCTHFFEPERKDWTLNIHRQGKAYVQPHGNHHDKCVFANHMYTTDREDITVKKIIPADQGPVDQEARYGHMQLAHHKNSDMERIQSQMSSSTSYASQQHSTMKQTNKFQGFDNENHEQQQQQRREAYEQQSQRQVSNDPQILNRNVTDYADTVPNRLMSKPFDSTHESLSRRRQTRQKVTGALSRSMEESYRNTNYDSTTSADYHAYNRPSSAASDRSESSVRHSKPRLLRKSKNVPGSNLSAPANILHFASSHHRGMHEGMREVPIDAC